MYHQSFLYPLVEFVCNQLKFKSTFKYSVSLDSLENNGFIFLKTKIHHTATHLVHILRFNEKERVSCKILQKSHLRKLCGHID